MRVLLQSPRTATFTGATRRATRKLDPDRTYRRAPRRSAAAWTCSARRPRARDLRRAAARSTGADEPVKLRGTAGNGVRDGAYRGWLEFRPGGVGERPRRSTPSASSSTSRGVVAAEAIPSWPSEALEAQAVAGADLRDDDAPGRARGFDQYADTRSQVYRGVAGENPNTNARGQRDRRRGRHLRRRADHHLLLLDLGRAHREHRERLARARRRSRGSSASTTPTTTARRTTAGGRCGCRRRRPPASSAGLVKGSFVGIKVTKRGASPRVVKAVVVGTGGRTTVTGATLKARFGLRDTWMTFNAPSADVGPPPAQDPADGAAARPRPADVRRGEGRRHAAEDAGQRLGDADRLVAALGLEGQLVVIWMPPGTSSTLAERRRACGPSSRPAAAPGSGPVEAVVQREGEALEREIS